VRAKVGEGKVSMLAVVVVVSWVGAAGAEEFELVTDRPDFTESASVVPPMRVQTEMGAEVSGESDLLALDLPGILLRAGLARNIEARFKLPSASMAWPDGGDLAVGYGSFGLGGKYVFALGETFAAGFIPTVSVPVEQTEVDAQGISASANLIWAWDVSDVVSLGGNFVVEAARIGALTGEVDVQYSGTLAAGYAVADRFGLFIESINFISHGEQAYAPWADAGATFLVTPLVQLDAYAGTRVDGPFDDWFAGAGASILW
jgi:hypothetical protein